MTTNHTQFLSTAAEAMKESAIRRMGAVLAAGRDIISFAPGYPAPDTFPWHEFSEIAGELLGSREPGVLQYGPTRGYRPLLDTITSIRRAVAHGVVYVAGEAFYVNGEGHNTLRLSFSAPPPERIEAGVARLAATLRAESEALATGAAGAGPGAP